MPASNAEIAELFDNLATLLELKGESVFKTRAYQRAARAIENLSFSLAQAAASGENLRGIPGVGKAISDKIHEFLTTGQVAAYEKVKAELPAGVLSLMEVPGIGPKTALLISKELGVNTAEELEQAIERGRLATLPRMGEKAIENIRRHLSQRRHKSQRTPIGEALPVAEAVVAALKEGCPSLEQVLPVGSLRRWEETIGDIDLVALAGNPQEVCDVLPSLPIVKEVLAGGPRKFSVVTQQGFQVDLWLGEKESFGALLQSFTGNRQHNIQLRDYANRLGLSLNEYGITDLKTGKLERFPDEASYYARLGLPYIPPELRAGMYELEAAQEGRLPRLIEAADLRGDLHVHSNWSDGRDDIETMLDAAAALGYEYMALTDHSSGRGIANGLSEERLREQIRLLRSLQARYDMTILSGSEVDIRADGSLDYSDELLAQLDVVVASVHSAMGQDADTMTRRLIKAMEHPAVTVIGHLSTRLLGRREPTKFHIDEVLAAARATGTALEINAAPERLDLKDTHAYRAGELGVPLVINTDSHHHTALSNRRFGIAVARRAWRRAQDVINTMPREQFLQFIRTPKPQRLRVFDVWRQTAR